MIRRHGLFDSAFATLKRSMDLTPLIEDRARRALAAADAGWIAGHLDDAKQMLGVARTTATGVEEAVDAAVLAARIGHVAGDVPETFETLIELADQVAGSDAQRAAGLLALAAELARAEPGGTGRALQAARRAAGLPQAGGEPAVLKALGGVVLDAGAVVEGVQMLAQAAEGYLGDPALREDPAALQDAAYCLERIDRFTQAHATAKAAIDLARDHGAVGLLPALLGLSGSVGVRLGQWESAAGDFAEATALALQLGQMAEWGYLSACAAELMALRGDVQAIELARDAARHAHHSDWTAHAESVVERTLALGDGDVSRLPEGVNLLEDRDWTVISSEDLDVVEVAIRAGKNELAVRVLEKMEANQMLPLAAARLARCRGLLADEESSFDDALARFDELHTPFETARTLLAVGELRRRRGARRAARPALRAALDVFDSLGAQAWAERAARELRMAGHGARRDTGRDGLDLTPQEEQIARLVAEGRTNREVGSMLFISPKTVEAHLSRVFRKLGVESRMELARRISTSP